MDMLVDDDAAQTREMLRDSAARLLSADQGLPHARRWRFEAPGFDRARWSRFCEMGWPGLALPEASGGAGLGLRDVCALMDVLGRALAPEPAVAATMAVRLLADDALQAVLAGERIVLPAWQEDAHGTDLAGATQLRDGRVTGRKQFILQAGGADAFVVTTVQGAALVEARAAGVALSLQPTHDGGQLGMLVLQDAPAIPLNGDTARVFDEAALAQAAYLQGVAAASLQATLDYLRTRKQFGRAIGSFQALQHRAVDLHIQLALTRASVEAAASTLDAGADALARALAVSRAKARASETALLITRASIQMHGAIGYTDEFDVGLYLRKAMVVASQFGSADAHRARFAALSPTTEEAGTVHG
ncbi:MAG: acyl-CoA dehydrogenase family protein [Burkholderiales bacterium]